MTVAVTTQKTDPYATDGVEDTFAFAFAITENSDLVVIYTDAAGADTTYVLDTDYTVTGGTTEGTGSITCTTAPANNGTLLIMRAVAQTQETDLATAGPLPAAAIEAALDRLTMQVQDLQEQINRIDLTPPTAGVGETALTQSAADLRYPKLTGSTLSANLSCAVAASTGNNYVNKTLLDSTDAAQTARFHLTTGHHHDGADAKKVIFSDIDALTGSPGIGSLLTVHTGGVIQGHAPTAAAQLASLVLTDAYQEVCSVSMVVPRTATYVAMAFTAMCDTALTGSQICSLDLKFLRDATQVAEVLGAFIFQLTSGAATAMKVPVAITKIHAPGSAATFAFKVQAKYTTGSQAIELENSALQILMWG